MALELDLSYVPEDVVFGFPRVASARRKRRWIRRTVVNTDVTGRIVSAVETDIRSRGLIDGDLREMIAEAAAGWFDYIRRVVEQADVVSSDLARAVLVSSGLGDRDVEMESFVFADDSDLLVERVSRELTNRLQVIYTHCGERLVDRFALDAGDPYSGDLADRMSFVVARSHFADA